MMSMFERRDHVVISLSRVGLGGPWPCLSNEVFVRASIIKRTSTPIMVVYAPSGDQITGSRRARVILSAGAGQNNHAA